MNIIYIWGLALLLSACHDKQGSRSFAASIKQDTVGVQIQTQFPFPEIPATLTEPEARKSYLLIHYWEQTDARELGELVRRVRRA